MISAAGKPNSNDAVDILSQLCQRVTGSTGENFSCLSRMPYSGIAMGQQGQRMSSGNDFIWTALREQYARAAMSAEIDAALPLLQAVVISQQPVVWLNTEQRPEAQERLVAFMQGQTRYSTQWLWDHNRGYIVLDVSSGEPETTQFAFRFEWPRDERLLLACASQGCIGLTIDPVKGPTARVVLLTISVDDLVGIMRASRATRQ